MSLNLTVFVNYILLMLFTHSALSADAKSYNIARGSVITAEPYIGATTRYLTDGVIDDASENTLVMLAPLAPRISGGVHLTYNFTFSKSVIITGINIFQCSARVGRTPAQDYLFEGDKEANGEYEIPLVVEKNGKGGSWFNYNLKTPVSLRSVRFRTQGWDDGVKGPNYGVPAVCEIEIISKYPLESTLTSNLQFGNSLLRIIPESTILISDNQKADLLRWDEQFPRGIFTTMWKYWNPGKPYDSFSNAFILKNISDIYANRLWLYPEATADKNIKNEFIIPSQEFGNIFSLRRKYEESQWAKSGKYRIYPFPSEVVIGFKDNILKKLTDQAHLQNIGVIVNQRLLPYGLKGWDFPRVSNPKQYPCVLSSRIVAETSKQLVSELIASGADGVALGGDEYFFHGHTGHDEDISQFCQLKSSALNNSCKPTCQSLFHDSTGLDVPKAIGDSNIYREWQIFEYTKLAELFSSLADVVKQNNKNGIVTSLFRPGEVKRAAYGVAYDVMGSIGGIDEFSSDPLWANDNFNGHYYIANETKKLMAASRHRKSVVTLQTTPHYDERPFNRPIMVYGSAISALMNGAKGINYYKDEYIFTSIKNSPLKIVSDVFKLIAYLDRNGLQNYNPPSRVALLYSRSSEDWWNLKYKNNALLGSYPTIYQNAIMEVLFRNGIAYEMYYLDQPDALNEISSADVIIIPFAYSISDKAVETIINAMNSGAKVIWLEGIGDTDEKGAMRKKNVLSVLSPYDVTKLNVNLTDYKDISDTLVRNLNALSNNSLPLLCETNNDTDIECGMLTNGQDYLIFILNWGLNQQKVTVKTSIEKYDYSCELIDLESVSKVTIGNNNACNSESLKEFDVVLDDGGLNIISVRRVAN